jgi:hypothetical protein
MSKIDNARALVNAWQRNDWGGGEDDPVKLADFRYAVVVQRTDDSWVVGANDATEVAVIYLNTLTGTEGYDETIEDVYDLETGQEATWTCHLGVTVSVGDDVGKVNEGSLPDGQTTA